MADKELFGNSEQLNDTISRAAVVDEIDGVDWYHQNQHGEMVHGANPDEHQAWYKAEDIYKAVESVPSAQQWIPTSERLPKVREWVLCQCRAGIMDVLRLTDDGSWNKNYPHAEYMSGFVIAWMPLPSPWEGGEE